MYKIFFYIIKKHLSTFFLVSLFSLCVIFIFDLSEILKHSEYKDLISEAIELCFMRIIYVYAQIMHYAFLLSTLIVLSSMVNKNEIITLKSSGMSTFKLLSPFLFNAIILSFSWLFIVHPIATHTQRQNVFFDKRLKNHMVKQKIWLTFNCNTNNQIINTHLNKHKSDNIKENNNQTNNLIKNNINHDINNDINKNTKTNNQDINFEISKLSNIIIHFDIFFENDTSYLLKNIFINIDTENIFAKKAEFKKDHIYAHNCMIFENQNNIYANDDINKYCNEFFQDLCDNTQQSINDKEHNKTLAKYNNDETNFKFSARFFDNIKIKQYIPQEILTIFSHVQWYYFSIYEYIFLTNYSVKTNLDISKYHVYINTHFINTAIFILYALFAALLFFRVNRYSNNKGIIGMITLVFVFSFKMINDFFIKLTIDEKISLNMLWLPCVICFVVIFLILVHNEE